MKKKLPWIAVGSLLVLASALGQTARQPKVAPGPNEPNWWDVLESLYALDIFEELENPATTSVEDVLGRFRKAGSGAVVFEPVLALGTESVTRGGWYRSSGDGQAPDRRELWSYQFKNGSAEIESGQVSKPPLRSGSSAVFDPGEEPFGLWISNDNFDDGGVFSEPRVVARHNQRLAAQPYKAMIYPYRESPTGETVPNAYLIGWEYSTNDDFQDVVCVVRKVELVR